MSGLVVLRDRMSSLAGQNMMSNSERQYNFVSLKHDAIHVYCKGQSGISSQPNVGCTGRWYTSLPIVE